VILRWGKLEIERENGEFQLFEHEKKFIQETRVI